MPINRSLTSTVLLTERSRVAMKACNTYIMIAVNSSSTDKRTKKKKHLEIETRLKKVRVHGQL